MNRYGLKSFLGTVCLFLGVAHQPANALTQYIGAGDPQNAIATGLSSLALKKDGTLIIWGSDVYMSTNAPSLSNYAAVARGMFHSLGLKSDGTLVGWGSYSHGQINVPSGSNYVAIAGGAYHSAALKSDGTLTAWGGGDNYHGEIDVPPGSNYVSIAAGNYHTLAVRSDGTLAAWGSNQYGQTDVPPLSNYVTVAAGGNHSLALTSEGTLVGWGTDDYGESDVPSGSNYVAIAAGTFHSLALKSDGTLVGWGRNTSGQIDVPSGSNYVGVAAGVDRSLAITRGGTLDAWGYEGYGHSNVPLPNADFGYDSGIVPNYGSFEGGFLVEISGANLGNGSDITNVTLCGIAASIVTQTIDSVTVIAAAGPLETGNVAVQSVSRGTTSRADGFTYKIMLDQTIDFPAIENRLVTETVALSATASSSLPVDFAVISGPAGISSGTNLVFSGTGMVTIEAAQRGNIDWNPALPVTNSFIVAAIDVLNGPASGGNTISIDLGVGSITNVLIGGVDAPILSGAGTFSVTVQVPSGLPSDTYDITVRSSDIGDVLLHSVYTINPAGSIGGIDPMSGPFIGGTEVEIYGSDLGDGSDITNVTLCGVSAAILSQTADSVAVITGAGSLGTGDVVVQSVSYGTTFHVDFFTYTKLDQTIGFPAIADRLVTDTVDLVATASSALEVHFAVISGPADISNGTKLTFSGIGMVAIEASQPGNADWHPAIPVTNLIFVADLDVLNGPAAGGNTITIDLGIGSITNILIGGKEALILSGSGTSAVTVQIPSGLHSGGCDINLQTLEYGNILLNAVYTLNPAGSIRGGDPQNAISAGASHSLALKKDGTLIGWGFNEAGQADVPPGSNYVAVAAGGAHSLALRTDGTLTGWGLNDNGQTDVPPGSNYVAIAAGGSHSLALRSDGSLIGWGLDNNGQTDVPSGSNYVAIAAGAAHSLALKSDGTLVAWGWNVFGQLNVPPGNDYAAVAAGMVHSLAVKSDGSMAGWEYNYHGQSDVPQGNDYVAVAAGGYHSLALKSDGTVIGWGSNEYGQTDVPPGSNYVAITTIGHHSLALKSDGTLIGWGLNDNGQTDVPSPNIGFGYGSGVNPTSGPFPGGTEVVISGVNLGSGSDITDVTLCGVAATIVTQTVDSVTVITGAGIPGTGDVVVQSVRYGTTISADGFTYEKINQSIDFSVTETQTVMDTVELSASATSGLDVQFTVVSGPGVISNGTNLNFTAAGQVLVEASQGGNVNWHPAQPVTNAVDVVGVITNVMPNAGTGAGGMEVIVSGLWLGNGSDITHVSLCDVEAQIITQDLHSVTVVSGETNTPVAITGAVSVVSGYGSVRLADAYTYDSPLPDAPLAVSAVDIASDRFTARWMTTADTTHYFLDVSESTNFTSFIGNYSSWNVGPSTAALVTGLVDGVTYWYRVRAANPYGSSTDSNLIEVPVSDHTPYVRLDITNGVASAGSSDAIDLPDLFHGSNMTYSVVSNTNPALVAAMIQGSVLLLEYAGGMTGTAAITVRATDYGGFSVDTTIIVAVVSEPGIDLGAVLFNPLTGLYEQTVTVTNTSSTLAAEAVTLTVTSLSFGADLCNATGTNSVGNPEIHWNGKLAPGASKTFTLDYSTVSTHTVPSATIEVSLSLQDVNDRIAGWAPALIGQPQSTSGILMFLIEFDAIPGRLYYIQYTDALNNPWKTVTPGIAAPVNKMQWIDSGPAQTESEPGSVAFRFYRVMESSE